MERHHGKIVCAVQHKSSACHSIISRRYAMQAVWLLAARTAAAHGKAAPRRGRRPRGRWRSLSSRRFSGSPCIEQGLPIAAIPECKEQAFVDKNMDFELGDGMRKGEDTAPPAWTDACPCTAWAGEARAPATASCGRLARSRRSAPCQLPPVAPRQAPTAERQGRQKLCVFNLSPAVSSSCASQRPEAYCPGPGLPWHRFESAFRVGRPPSRGTMTIEEQYM